MLAHLSHPLSLAFLDGSADLRRSRALAFGTSRRLWRSMGSGIGFKDIPLDFLIIDAVDGRPIPLATIRFVDQVPETVLTTGRDGHVAFVFRNAPVESTRYYPLVGSPVKVTLDVNYWWELSVNAEGYDERRLDMGDLTKDPRYHYEAVPPTIVVQLEKRATRP